MKSLTKINRTCKISGIKTIHIFEDEYLERKEIIFAKHLLCSQHNASFTVLPPETVGSRYDFLF